MLTKRSSSPHTVVITPGGSGGTIATTPFSSVPHAEASVSRSSCRSYPYAGNDGLPNLFGVCSTPGTAVRIGQPVSVCQ